MGGLFHFVMSDVLAREGAVTIAEQVEWGWRLQLDLGREIDRVQIDLIYIDLVHRLQLAALDLRLALAGSP